ncbi:hypothetical protein LJR016_003546 [Devosia sp. LjRoot16]|uniref:hypothetical protein n=1 Tax=unclassified Devosia TaxID=196773 RepID=UPI0006F65D62|nr:hypothetical protein [Devosia sp. Root105]KQU97442.1 hypothetical protein ASC68_11590 [Devosia sp. Root105]
MSDLDKALADIVEIKSRLAQSSEFLGLGPAALATSGLLAFAVAALQSVLPGAAEPMAYFTGWVLTAIVAVALIGAEMLRRAQRHHAGLADQMIREAVLNFVPAGVAGAALLAFFARFAPEQLWLVPGLWLILVSLGIFAAVRSLPRAIALAGAWYLLSGFTVLLFAAGDQTLSPWHMGLPFAVGQLLIAGIVHRASEAANVR